jgi:hypothetical protein
VNRPTGLTGILFCYFSTHRVDGTRQIGALRFAVLGLLPILVGAVLARRLGVPGLSSLQLYIAVVAVLAAVLIGLLPLIHSVLGQVNADRKYDPGERGRAEQELNRIRVLQDLHASVCWAVILLVCALAVSVVLVLLPDYIPETAATTRSTTTKWSLWAQYAATMVLFTVAASTSLSFFDIARGVFEAVENHAESLKAQIERNIGK